MPSKHEMPRTRRVIAAGMACLFLAVPCVGGLFAGGTFGAVISCLIVGAGIGGFVAAGRVVDRPYVSERQVLC